MAMAVALLYLHCTSPLFLYNKRNQAEPRDFAAFPFDHHLELRRKKKKKKTRGMEPWYLDSMVAAVTSPTSAAPLLALLAPLGTFELDIRVPYKYPCEPPQVKFITKIWHANRETGETGHPAKLLKRVETTLLMLLLYLQTLLSKPESVFSLDTLVAQQHLNDYPAFVAQAQNWTEDFAKDSSWIK